MLEFLRRIRRRRVLARHSIPTALWHDTLAEVASLDTLDHEARDRLRDLAVLFLHEKSLEAADGFELTDAMRARIAVLACRPILELGLDAYRGAVSIVVYPGEFIARGREFEDEDGVVHVGDDVLSGESWDHGPIVLGWEEVRASGCGDGFDVVAHEFAHKLDLLDGAINGMPALHAGMSRAAWIEAFEPAYAALRLRVANGDEDTWLDPYAAESPAEFFAVCTEMFFDVPAAFAAEYPLVYAELAEFFRQDPAGERRAPV
jgi:MtfA peptidase